MSLKRLKIVLGECAGSGMTMSKVVDADTGEEFDNVRAISIRAAVDDVTRVTLELIGVAVEGEVEGVVDVTAIGGAGWKRHARQG